MQAVTVVNIFFKKQSITLLMIMPILSEYLQGQRGQYPFLNRKIPTLAI